MADIFVSYTSSDRDWAFWIAKELATLGHTPHVHDWEIKGGDDIYAWMERHHDAADHVLCVVSDEYLKAPYSTLERNAALWHAASKRPGFVLLVAVKPCRFPTLTDHLRRCELHGRSDDEKRKSFREFMSKREAPADIIVPGAYAVSNVPIRVPTLFMGRDDALEEIETALKRYEGRVAITALHGLRGVGKTTLAAAYAERHRANYRATWWIRAPTESTMRADLVGLGVRLKWVAADEKEEPALSAVTERLRQEGAGILLIYDNAGDADVLRPYLPRGGHAHVLITANAHAWRGVAEPVEIRLWPKDIGAQYLIRRSGREGERAAALALSEALGGLPLAHEQAAFYCERLDISLAEYQVRFEAAPARFLDDARHAPAEYHDGLTVAKTFALAIDEAAKLHPAAEPLIVHAALLAPDAIPLFVFAEPRARRFGEPLASALAGDGLDEAVAALRTFALIDRESISDERDPTISTACIRLHRLVRQVAATRRQGEALESARRSLVKAVAAAYPESAYKTSSAWPRARRLDAISMGLVGGNAAPPEDAEKSASYLLDRLASYRQRALADFAGARLLYERSLAIREQVFGDEHPETAKTMNDLALLLRAQGDLEGARPLFERALAIRQKVLGPEHPGTANSLNNLANLLQRQGELAHARVLFERALTIREKVLGPEHPVTARSRNNLAVLLETQGDFAASRLLKERALDIHERMLGPEHRTTARSLHNLAVLRELQNDLSGARALYERALTIKDKVLGPEHLDTAITLNNLGKLLTEQGDLARARTLSERALAIREKVLGPEHPDSNRTRLNLAMLLLASGSADQALALGKVALTAHDQALGPNHAWTKDSARGAADALDALGRADDAKVLRERYGFGTPASHER
jgi:tetratricopeptide (TPR) repeat protein